MGTRGGEIVAVDVTLLDATRRGPPGEVDSRAYMDLGGPIEHLYLTRDGARLAAVLSPGFETEDAEHSEVVVIDAGAAQELESDEICRRGMGYVPEDKNSSSVSKTTGWPSRPPMA